MRRRIARTLAVALVAVSTLTLCAAGPGSEPASAVIEGTVLFAGSGVPGEPIEGAEVRVRADADGPVAVTDSAGRFVLDVAPVGTVRVVASRTYDPSASRNVTSRGVDAENGADVTIRLESIPTIHNVDYQPIRAAAPGGCGDCHPGQVAAWNSSAHAGAALDEWVLDLYSGDGTPGGAAGYVYRDLHPDDTGFCATCHAPAAEAQAPGTAFLDEISTDAAREGVTCSTCHQLAEFPEAPEAIVAMHTVGDPPSARYRFPLDGPNGSTTHEYVWGPLADVDYPFMKASHTPAFESSRLCASCHDYDSPTGIPGQTTYREWLESPYAIAGAGFRTCQDCHMPSATEPGPISDPVIGDAPIRPASQRHDHGFASADPATLAASLEVVLDARLVADRIEVDAAVWNLGGGHSFPTGVSLRNALLVVDARVDGAPLELEHGPVLPGWASDDVPGEQPGDLAGSPGLGFAKVLRGTIDGVVTEPVIFLEADTVVSDTRIPAAGSSGDRFVFAAPADLQAGDTIEVDAQLLYRRAWRALAVTKGWTETPAGDPIERTIETRRWTKIVAATDLVLFADGFESGGVGAWSG